MTHPDQIDDGQMTLPPTAEAELRWLVDRAEIHDLMVEYGRRIDSKDFSGMAELFASDGYIELPFATFPRDVLPEPEHAEVLSRYAALQHSYSNLAVEIDGDTARSRLYFTAVHVLDEPGHHGDVGGTYTTSYRRVAGFWRLVTVRVDFTWTDGRGFPGVVRA